MSQPDEDLLRFIAASFPSVWALEVLLALKSAGNPLQPEVLVTNLRASDVVVSKAISALIAAGLASLEGEGVIYLPVNDDVENSVARLEKLYRTRPNTVRRAIVGAGTSGATAFAAAFKIRRTTDD